MRSRVSVLTALVLVLPFFGGLARAQEGGEVAKQLEDMKRQLDELRKENKELRTRVEGVEQGAAPKRGFSEEDRKLLGDLIERYHAEKAPAAPSYPSAPQISGLVYAQYSMQLKDVHKVASDGGANSVTSDSTNGRDAQIFDITRAYLSIREDFAENTSGQLMLDAAGQRNPGDRNGFGNFAVLLKLAFLEQRELWPDSTVQFGLVPLPWVPWEEGLYTYRMQGTIFSDREGYLAPVDFGLGVKGKLPSGHGDYHVTYINGEGFNKAEGQFRHSAEVGAPDSFDTKHKNVEARLSIRPFPESEYLKGLLLTEFIDYGYYASARDIRVRNIAAVTYKYDCLTFMGQYLYASDPRSFAPQSNRQVVFLPDPRFGTVDRAGALPFRHGTAVGEGWSVWAVLNWKLFHESLADFEFLARYDELDPDEDVANNDHFRTIHGVSWRMNKNVRLMVDYETVRFDKARAVAAGGVTGDDGTGDTRPDTDTLFFQAEIKF
ncbi:MAG: hypothetical protein HYZ53_05085 [Planctomycetes bacterium]|nr:hypothetical protein [Planctomycetota bacterium]